MPFNAVELLIAEECTATEVVEVHQSYVLRENTSKKLSSMKERVVARRMRRDIETHNMLGCMLGRMTAYKDAQEVDQVYSHIIVYLVYILIHVQP